MRKRTEFATIDWRRRWRLQLVPFAVETGGRLGADVLRFRSELGDVAAASNARLSKTALVRRAAAELACALCRGNAGVYAGSMSRLLRGARSAMQVGEIVAMEEQCACFRRRGWYFSSEFLGRSTCSIL